MTEDLLSLRALVVSRESGLRDLFRQSAAAAAVPIEILEAADAASACNSLAGNDLVYLDGALSSEEIAQVVRSLRAAEKPPFSIHLAVGAAAVAFATDAVAGRPSRLDESQWLLDRSMRVRLPSRVLVVDDSATMRSIVRKALAATRFPFYVSDAGEGFTALNMVRGGEFDLVFLDYNMPGFSGLETLAEIKREQRDVGVIMITSTTDDSLAKRAREMGAAFLKKPFFPSDIENLLCGFYDLRALYPRQN
jgi:CheY-like chemotaxis protein